jgi:hypothetical protein
MPSVSGSFPTLSCLNYPRTGQLWGILSHSRWPGSILDDSLEAKIASRPNAAMTARATVAVGDDLARVGPTSGAPR